MKNERPPSVLRDGSLDFGKGVIGGEAQRSLTQERIIPIRHDSRLGRAIGLRFGSRLLPVAGVLSLIAVACSAGEGKIGQQAQASEDSKSDNPSVSESLSPTSEWILTPEPPTLTAKPPPTEPPTSQPPTPEPTLDPDIARKRLEARRDALQKAQEGLQPTVTPSALIETPTPKPPITETPFPTQTPELKPTPTPEAEKRHVVKPVLFIPKGLERPVQIDEEDLNNINNAMKEVQRFYAEQLDGKTFQYENAILIRGQKDLQFYCLKPIEKNQCVQDPSRDRLSDPKVLDKILQDIQKQDSTFSKKGQVVVIFWVGGSGYALGGWSNQDISRAMMGDWTLDSIGKRYAKGTDTAGCRGSLYPEIICVDGPRTTLHELGHTLGLDHPNWRLYDKSVNERLAMTPYPNACMWPKCEFLPSEKQTLLKSPFIHVIFDAKK